MGIYDERERDGVYSSSNSVTNLMYITQHWSRFYFSKWCIYTIKQAIDNLIFDTIRLLRTESVLCDDEQLIEKKNFS